MKGWDSTLCFRRFRKKHTELSHIYWTHVLGADAIRGATSKADPGDYTVDATNSSFPRNMLPLKVSEIGDWLDDYLGRVRLHLLLVCASHLEAYLKEVCLVHLLAAGYGRSHTKLNAVGEAIGSPILDRYSLPEPLKYAEQLFGVAYATALTIWQRSYKIRCALAHNGGIVTARTLKEVPDIGLPVNASIVLSWPDLFESLSAADDIATITDRRVASKEVKQAEIAMELQYLKEVGRLPTRNAVWKYLHDSFGLTRTKKEFRAFVEKEFYP